MCKLFGGKKLRYIIKRDIKADSWHKKWDVNEY
jgi:hypothetical protein